MRPSLWFLLGLALDVLGLDLYIFHGDVQSLYMLCPTVILSLGMALITANRR
jgi:hypothetical protein